ncbi:MAG: hypothetical protein ABI780_07255 [Ardenticatenales bacterium]
MSSPTRPPFDPNDPIARWLDADACRPPRPEFRAALRERMVTMPIPAGVPVDAPLIGRVMVRPLPTLVAATLGMAAALGFLALRSAGDLQPATPLPAPAVVRPAAPPPSTGEERPVAAERPAVVAPNVVDRAAAPVLPAATTPRVLRRGDAIAAPGAAGATDVKAIDPPASSAPAPAAQAAPPRRHVKGSGSRVPEPTAPPAVANVTAAPAPISGPVLPPEPLEPTAAPPPAMPTVPIVPTPAP